MGYIYYYNNAREQSSFNYQTAFAILKKKCLKLLIQSVILLQSCSIMQQLISALGLDTMSCLRT